MSKIFRKALIASPAALGALLAVSSDAVANPISGETPESSTSDLLQQIEDYSAEGTGNSMDQFNGATQFSDVSPGDWAFQALDDLVRRYDCLKGYPDGTYRGNRALSRYEFAAGLNACLQQIERLIAETTAEFATREDLETLRRLMQEFEAELATLGTRVDNLEARVAFLEDNQFSTTTKLEGMVAVDLAAPFADQKATAFGNQLDRTDLVGTLAGTVINDGLSNLLDINNLQGLLKGVGVTNSVNLGEYITANTGIAGTLAQDLTTLAGGTDNNADDNATFGYLAHLNFNTSFFGTDLLQTRLEASNQNSLLFQHLGTTQLDRTYSPNTAGVDDSVVIDNLGYSFNMGSKVRAHIFANGADIGDVLDIGSTAPYTSDNLHWASAYNTLFYEAGSAKQAIGFNIGFSDSIVLDIAYMPGQGNDASRGVFGGEYVLPVQLNFYGDKVNVALSYAHLYEKGGDFIDANGNLTNATTFAGYPGSSVLGQNPFIYASGTTGELQSSAGIGNMFGLQASFDLSDSFNISGYLGYGTAVAVSGPRTGDDAEYWSWGLNLAFPDLGKEGAVLVGGFGQLPRMTVDNGPDDVNASYMANLEYRFPVTDNIQLAPGAYAVFSPNGNAANDTIWVGMLRTILSF